MTEDLHPSVDAKHIFVAGRVQGVGFRASFQYAANQVGAVGWCRNTPDGQVEGWLQGTPQQVAHLLAWCHHGPPMAQVQHVTAHPALPDPTLDGFEVRR